MSRPIGGTIEEQAEWVIGEAMAETFHDVATDEEIDNEIEWWIATDVQDEVRAEAKRQLAARQKNDDNCDVDAVAIEALNWVFDMDSLGKNNLTESLKEYLNDNDMSHKHIDAIVEKFGEHVVNAVTIYRNAKKESRREV